MIYLKNNTEKQTIFIPRNELQKEAYITTIRTYEDGLKEGYGNGIEDQKDQLLNLYVTENGVYEREDGYGKVTVDIEGGTDCKEAIEDAYEDGYNEGYERGKAEGGGGNCNLEDKIIAPQTNEVDGNGWIYVYPNEGYDGMKEVALQTNDLKNGWYNEGYNEGVEQGGGGSELVLGHNLEVIGTNGRHIFYPQNNGWNGFDLFEVEVEVPTTAKLQDVWVEPTMADVDGNNLLVYSPNTDEGYDGLSRVVVNPSNIYNEGVEQGRNESIYFSIKTFSAYCKGGVLEGSFNKNEVYNVHNENRADTLEIREKVTSNDEKYNIFTKATSLEGGGYNTYIEGGFALKKSNITQMEFGNVQGIRANVFSGCELLEEITFKNYQAAIPNLTINELAFGNCPNLKKIVLDITIPTDYPPIFYDIAFEGCPTDGTIYVREDTQIDALQLPYPLSEWTVKIID